MISYNPRIAYLKNFIFHRKEIGIHDNHILDNDTVIIYTKGVMQILIQLLLCFLVSSTSER